MGLAFLLNNVYLFPLMAMCLTFSVGGLAISAKKRRGYAPFCLGIFSALLLMVGKFFFAWSYAVYGGAVLLLIASLWNSWPPRRPGKLKFNADGSVSRVEATASK